MRKRPLKHARHRPKRLSTNPFGATPNPVNRSKELEPSHPHVRTEARVVEIRSAPTHGPSAVQAEDGGPAIAWPRYRPWLAFQSLSALERSFAASATEPSRDSGELALRAGTDFLARYEIDPYSRLLRLRNPSDHAAPDGATPERSE